MWHALPWFSCVILNLKSSGIQNSWRLVRKLFLPASLRVFQVKLQMLIIWTRGHWTVSFPTFVFQSILEQHFQMLQGKAMLPHVCCTSNPTQQCTLVDRLVFDGQGKNKPDSYLALLNSISHFTISILHSWHVGKWNNFQNAKISLKWIILIMKECAVWRCLTSNWMTQVCYGSQKVGRHCS